MRFLKPTVAAAAVAVSLSMAPAASADPGMRISVAHTLPGDRAYPEGIALDHRTGDMYAGSYEDGTVYKMTPGVTEAEVFLPAGADGRDTANGMKVDRWGRLWVTDSTTGVQVYDTRTRRLLASFTVPGEGGRFVNDVAIGADGSAYLTDSVRAVVYRVTPAQLRDAWGGTATLTTYFELGGMLDPHPPEAFTLNGIVADPFGRYLLVVDMTGGDLFRFDLASERASRVELKGRDLKHADGMEIRFGRLWAVHNAIDTVTRWRLSWDGSTAWLRESATDPRLEVPTTLVRRNGTLYVVRSQFDEGGPAGPGTPEVPFSIAAVRGI